MNVSKYNLTWYEQSKNSGESMPCGGFDCGANVWVENGDLLLYVDRSGSFDENNQMLKLGRFRLSFSEKIFESGFSQTLQLDKGNILIKNDSGEITIWFDTFNPACNIDIRLKNSVSVKATYESWRFEEREIPHSERMAPASYNAYPGYVATYPDTVEAENGEIVFFHKNRNNKLLFDFLVDLQGLNRVKNELDNFQKDFIFGGKLIVPDSEYVGESYGEYAYVPYKAYSLQAPEKKEHNIKIKFHSEQVSDTDMWKDNLNKVDLSSKESVLGWWRNFWQRSYIDIKTEKGFELSRNYALFRYMLGCNAYGEYPTKFNGGLFTTDAVFSVGEEHKGKTPDFRRWGGGSFTGQNQRLVYWGMLKSGDNDMMISQFDFYHRALNNACVRTREYWNHGGCSFTEQLENLGLPIGWTWGFPETHDDPIHKRPAFYDPAEQISPWIRYYYSSQLEFSFMILKYYLYTKKDISKYIPFIEASVEFFIEHYKFMAYRSTLHELNKNGKLDIFPSSALENCRDALNPTDAVCGLRTVISLLSELNEYVDGDYYKKLMEIIPEIPMSEIDGNEVIAPAGSYRERVGDEFPELYPVYPYEFFNVSTDNLPTAIHTWNTRDVGYHTYVSWRQEPIFAARLGLTGEAKALTIKKLQNCGRKFPAFWGPDHDWCPDHNRGGSGMIALQEMLMQEYEGKIFLLPAWDKNDDMEFKLHLTDNSQIEVKYINHKLSYKITGSKTDFQVVNCFEGNGYGK